MEAVETLALIIVIAGICYPILRSLHRIENEINDIRKQIAKQFTNVLTKNANDGGDDNA